MSNIRVDVGYTIKDGTEIKFRSPVDCSAVTGLIVYYPGADGSTVSKVFAFADAHGNNVGNIDHLFAENIFVNVILDVTTSMAFVQNADTNAYLEAQLASKAPAGYGLGNKDNVPVITDWGTLNSVVQPGWYKVAFNTWYTGEQIMRVDAMDKQIVQTFMQFDGVLKIGSRAKAINSDWSELVDYSASAFAPAGYGYGGELPTIQSTGTTADAFESAVDTFLASMPTHSAKQVKMDDPSLNTNWNIGTIYKVTNDYAVIFAFNFTGQLYIKHKLSTWQPWEFVNPPMLAGVEYRTTERWNGKPVYTAFIDCQYWAVGKTVTPENITLSKIIGYRGYAGSYSLPFIDNDLQGAYAAYVSVENNANHPHIVLRGKLINSYAVTHVQIWYVKD